MAVNLIIGGQLYIPGRQLTFQQMTAIQLSIALGTGGYSDAASGTLQAQAYAQYVAQGGQQFIADAIASGALSTASSGDIVGNANQARDENANQTLPSPPPQVITPQGRIQPAGSGADGAGATAGTNAVATPTQQNTPTVGTDDAVRLISQTQAINTKNNTSGQLVIAEDGSVSTLRRNPETGELYDPGPNAAPVGSPGAGAGADAGSTVVSKTASPFPQYRPRTQSYVYKAIKVVSVFKQGRFEQVLHGQLFTQQTGNTQPNVQQRPAPVNKPKPINTNKPTTEVVRKPTVGDLPMKQQAAIATGTDPNTVNDQGMAFGGGGL